MTVPQNRVTTGLVVMICRDEPHPFHSRRTDVYSIISVTSTLRAFAILPTVTGLAV